MTIDVDQLLSEVDAGVASIATGNRTLALKMAEFLFELDSKLTEVLENRVPAADYQEVLAKLTGLEAHCGSLEQDLKDAISNGEAWEKACVKVHRQVLDLVGVQSETHELVLSRLAAARDNLPEDPPAGPSLEEEADLSAEEAAADTSADVIPLPDLEDEAAEDPVEASENRWDSPQT